MLSYNEIALALQGGAHIYVPEENFEYVIKQKEAFFDDGFSDIEVLNILKPYLENKNKKIIIYSYKKLAPYLTEFDISVNANYHDVDILRYLVDFSGKE